MFGFEISSISYDERMGSKNITVVKEGLEICYMPFAEEWWDGEITHSEMIELCYCGHPVGRFYITSKRWFDNYSIEVVNAPREWKEEYFKLVDQMITILNTPVTL